MIGEAVTPVVCGSKGSLGLSNNGLASQCRMTPALPGRHIGDGKPAPSSRTHARTFQSYSTFLAGWNLCCTRGVPSAPCDTTRSPAVSHRQACVRLVSGTCERPATVSCLCRPPGALLRPASRHAPVAVCRLAACIRIRRRLRRSQALPPAMSISGSVQRCMKPEHKQ